MIAFATTFDPALIRSMAPRPTCGILEPSNQSVRCLCSPLRFEPYLLPSVWCAFKFGHAYSHITVYETKLLHLGWHESFKHSCGDM
eukprot:5858917-Amphidinium_carterae.1